MSETDMIVTGPEEAYDNEGHVPSVGVGAGRTERL
jgi:hypothetical protein